MMQSKSLRVGVLVGVISLLAASHASAIPTFARRYATSCATCHQAYPRLNPVGESFRVSGFRFVDDERYRKEQPVELGDEAYKRLWPKALWPSDVSKTAPISVMTRFMVEVDIDGSRPNTMTYLLPEEIEIVWAGNIGEDLVFYGDIIYLQKDFGGQKPDSWASLKAWLQFQNLFGVENKLNLRLGTVGTQTMGLFTARDANFYGTHTYLYTSWSLPKVDVGAADLTSFNGNNFFIGAQAGFEINGFGKQWYYALGLVNGNSETHPTDPPPADITFWGMGQGNGIGDVYGHFAYKFGGMPFDRSQEDMGSSLTVNDKFWRDDATTFSLFGYYGNSTITMVDLGGVESEGDQDFWRLGAGLQHQVKDMSFSVAYLAGNDESPYMGLTGESIASQAWHLEILGFAFPWMMPYGRYEALTLDMPEDVPGINPEQDISRILAGVKFMIRPNVFCVVEGAHYTKGAELEEGFDQTLFILLSATF